MTDRAVSTVVGYVIMVGIAGILLATLTLTASGLVDTQDERTAHAEMDVYGERLAADISTADRLAQQDSTKTTMNVTSDLPDTVNGHRYTITIGEEDDSDGTTTIVLQSDDFDRSVETGVANTTPIEHGEIRGGAVTITYDDTDGELVIKND